MDVVSYETSTEIADCTEYYAANQPSNDCTGTRLNAHQSPGGTADFDSGHRSTPSTRL